MNTEETMIEQEFPDRGYSLEALMKAHEVLTVQKKLASQELEAVRDQILMMMSPGDTHKIATSQVSVYQVATRSVSMKAMAGALPADVYDQVTTDKADLGALDRAFEDGLITPDQIRKFVKFTKKTSLRMTLTKPDEGESA